MLERPPRKTRWPIRTVEERFWSHVNKGEGCWEWTGTISAGYGHFAVGHNNVRSTHRLVWQWTHGPIPEGMFVCHRCDNRRCVRVTHLFLGTAFENSMDMVSKGRGGRPKKAACKYGHPFPESRDESGKCGACAPRRRDRKNALRRQRISTPEEREHRRVYQREWERRQRQAAIA